MDTEQSEETQASDKTECLSEPESSLYTPKSDRQRARSLPVDLDRDASSSHKEHPTVVRAKRVQFADMMGLNLANVRHFNISDDANETRNVSSGLWSRPPNQQLQRFAPAFEMPVSSLEFDMKSRRLGVALESVTITPSEVKGVIRVTQSNAREVGVRYTLNNWLTFSDIQAALRPKEEKVLQFDFILHTPLCFDKDSSIHSFMQFAVYCRTDDREYWDNNDGRNYTLKIT